VETSHSFSASKLDTACFVISRLSSLLGIAAIMTACYVYFPSLIQYYFLGKFKQYTWSISTPKKDDKNNDGSKVKIFYSQNLLLFLYHVNIYSQNLTLFLYHVNIYFHLFTKLDTVPVPCQYIFSFIHKTWHCSCTMSIYIFIYSQNLTLFLYHVNIYFYLFTKLDTVPVPCQYIFTKLDTVPVPCQYIF